MLEASATLAGIALLLLVWLSVLRTVLLPGTHSARLTHGTVPVLMRVCLVVARVLRRPLCERVLEFYAPVSLFVVAVTWLAGHGLAFVLLAWGCDAVLGPAVVTATSALLVYAAFLAYLTRFLAACDRRDRMTKGVLAQAVKVTDAERVLAGYLRAGSRDSLDRRFERWAEWLADIHSSHVSFPGLIYHRPGGTHWWPTLLLVVLDTAALVQAVAPRWAPPNTKLLLDSGSALVQQMAARMGIVLPVVRVSLQGREERGFADTLRLATDSGLPVEREPDQAWRVYQDIRVRYAPYAVMIGARLFHKPEDDTDR